MSNPSIVNEASKVISALTPAAGAPPADEATSEVQSAASVVATVTSVLPGATPLAIEEGAQLVEQAAPIVIPKLELIWNFLMTEWGHVFPAHVAKQIANAQTPPAA